jgi:hypothetical protein
MGYRFLLICVTSAAGHVPTLRSTRSRSVFDSIGFLRNPASPEYSARSRQDSSECPVMRMTFGASAAAATLWRGRFGEAGHVDVRDPAAATAALLGREKGLCALETRRLVAGCVQQIAQRF